MMPTLRLNMSDVGKPGDAGPGTYGGDPGDNSITRIARSLEATRGTVIETPVLFIALAYIYDKTIMDGTNEEWGFGDVLAVLIASYFLQRTAVKNRFNRVLG